MNNTTSQLYAKVAMIAGIVGGVCAALLPTVNLLPPKFNFVAVVVGGLASAASVVVAAYNQSLSGDHASVPIYKLAKLPPSALSALGAGVLKQLQGNAPAVAPGQTEGK